MASRRRLSAKTSEAEPSCHAGSEEEKGEEWCRNFHATYEKSSTKLGAGTFGEVVTGNHRVTHEPCALKRIWRQSYDDQQEDLKREVQILMLFSDQKKHRHIIQAFDTAMRSDIEKCNEGDDVGWIAMELCSHHHVFGTRRCRQSNFHVDLRISCVAGLCTVAAGRSATTRYMHQMCTRDYVYI